MYVPYNIIMYSVVVFL